MIVLRSGQVLEGTVIDRLPSGYLVRLATGTRVVAYEEVSSVNPPVGGAPAAALPPPPVTPPPPPVFGAAPVAPPPAEPHLGKAGQLIITDTFGYLSHSGNTTTFEIDPAVHFLVSDYFTLGVELAYAHSSTTTKVGTRENTSTSSQLGAGLDLGVHAAVSELVSVWPTIFGGYVHPSAGSDSLLLGSGFAVLFHPVPHFFLGLEPGVNARRATEGTNQSFQYTQRLYTLIGGWW
jgi:hypothetical protein